MTILPKNKLSRAEKEASSSQSSSSSSVVVGSSSAASSSSTSSSSTTTSGGHIVVGPGIGVTPSSATSSAASGGSVGDPGGGTGSGGSTGMIVGVNPPSVEGGRKRTRDDRVIESHRPSLVVGHGDAIIGRDHIGPSMKRTRSGGMVGVDSPSSRRSTHRHHHQHLGHGLAPRDHIGASSPSPSVVPTTGSAATGGPKRNTPSPSPLVGLSLDSHTLSLGDMSGGGEGPLETKDGKGKEGLKDGNNNNSASSSTAPPELMELGLLPPGLVIAGAPDESVNITRSPPSSPTGYNSGDEYGAAASQDTPSSNRGVERHGHSHGGTGRHPMTPEEIVSLERRFEKALRKKGLFVVKMGEDGSCLFRSVADQVYGDEEMHQLVRKLCCDYMTKNSDYFSQYVTEEFSQYVARKRRDHIQGNHIELQALSELFARPIEVYHYSSEPINIFQSGHEEELMLMAEANMEPIRLSYHTPAMVDCGHYNSVRALHRSHTPKATLIHYTPPHSMETAIRDSEADELEKAMLEDKIRATDWEATNEALEEQVARESYLQWLRDNERRRRANSNGSSNHHHHNQHNGNSCSTVTSSDALVASGGSPKASGSRSSPPRSPNSWQSFNNNNLFDGHHLFPHPPHHNQSNHTKSRRSVSPNPMSPSHRQRHHHHQSQQQQPDLVESMLYFQDDIPDCPEAEREIIARVMLASRQEYLDDLKKKKGGETKSRSPSRSSTPPPSSSSTSAGSGTSRI